MSIDIGFTLKKAYEVLIKCPEMKLYALLLFLNSGIMALYNYGAPDFRSMVKVEYGRIVYVSPNLINYVIFFIILLFISVIFSVWFSSAAIKSTYDHLKGSSSSSTSMRRALRALPYVLGATILYGIAVISPIFLSLFLLFSPICCCLVVLVVFALIIYFGLRLAFFAPPIVIFKKSAIDGLKESWEVTNGNLVDVGVFFLIISVIDLPIYALSSVPRNLPLSLLTSLITAFLNLWIIAAVTIAYLQLAGKYGPEGFTEIEDRAYHSSAPMRKLILLIGFTGDEVREMEKIGLPVYSINQNSRMFTLREILENPESHYGDSTWTSERYAILHGFQGDEILDTLQKINSHAKGEVKFATSTEDSMEWTISYLIKELGGKDYIE
jgi:hypothetical protein